MLNVPKTYFGDPVQVWLEEGCDTPLLCLDFTGAIDSDGEALVNFELSQGHLLALQILKAVACVSDTSEPDPRLDIAS